MTQKANSGKTVKFLYSYGGKIVPRLTDGKLRYAGGFNRVLAVDRSISYAGNNVISFNHLLSLRVIPFYSCEIEFFALIFLYRAVGEIRRSVWIFDDFEVQITDGGSGRVGHDQIRWRTPSRDRRVREGFSGFADQSRFVSAEIGEENHAAFVSGVVFRFPLNVETLRRGSESAVISESSTVSEIPAVRRRSPVCSYRRRIPRRCRKSPLLRREEYEASLQRAAPDL